MKKKEMKKVRGATVWLWALPFVNALELRLGRQRNHHEEDKVTRYLRFRHGEYVETRRPRKETHLAVFVHGHDAIMDQKWLSV
jgi:hypothetical protein